MHEVQNIRWKATYYTTSEIYAGVDGNATKLSQTVISKIESTGHKGIQQSSFICWQMQLAFSRSEGDKIFKEKVTQFLPMNGQQYKDDRGYIQTIEREAGTVWCVP